MLVSMSISTIRMNSNISIKLLWRLELLKYPKKSNIIMWRLWWLQIALYMSLMGRGWALSGEGSHRIWLKFWSHLRRSTLIIIFSSWYKVKQSNRVLWIISPRVPKNSLSWDRSNAVAPLLVLHASNMHKFSKFSSSFSNVFIMQVKWESTSFKVVMFFQPSLTFPSLLHFSPIC